MKNSCMNTRSEVSIMPVIGCRGAITLLRLMGGAAYDNAHYVKGGVIWGKRVVMCRRAPGAPADNSCSRCLRAVQVLSGGARNLRADPVGLRGVIGTEIQGAFL